MPNDETVNNNLKGMDDLDFVGWNNADWTGVFAHHHTDDVLVPFSALVAQEVVEHVLAERLGDQL